MQIDVEDNACNDLLLSSFDAMARSARSVVLRLEYQ